MLLKTIVFSFTMISSVSSSTVNIISLPPERWREYRDLRLQALEECPEAYGIAPSDESGRTQEEWQDAYQGTTKWFVFAESEGKLIGMLGAETPTGSHMQHVVEIIRAYVDPAYRRQGIFRKLLSSLKDLLKKESQVEQMIVWTTRYGNQEEWIEHIYNRIGFSYCGTLPNIVKIGKQRYECSWLTSPL